MRQDLLFLLIFLLLFVTRIILTFLGANKLFSLDGMIFFLLGGWLVSAKYEEAKE